MTSLTQTVASLNDALVPSLSFAVPKAASYVVSRQSQHVYPVGGSEFRPVGGTNLIRINLATSGWWDPLTCRLRFKLTNNNSKSSSRFHVILAKSLRTSRHHISEI